MARSRFQTSPLTPEELAILQSLENLPDSGSTERLQKVGGVIVNTETGDVVGPATHGDNVVPRFDGTDTNDLKTSSVTISDLGVMTLGANGVSGFDAVTFQQLEDAIAGLKAKQSVRVATNGAGVLSTDFAAGQTVDGEVLVAGDRILIKDQAAQEENGIYIVQATGAPVRSSDADTWDELVSAYCYVEHGLVNADKGFLCTINSGGTLGVDPITWTVFAVSGGGITSLNGLTDASQSFTTTTTGTDFTVSSAAGVHSLNLPDASTTARGVVTTGSQTFAGEKTMQDALTLSTAPTLDDHAATKKYVDDQLGSTISGTIAADEVAFGTGADSIGGSSTFTYNSGTNVLNIESSANTVAISVTDTPLQYNSDQRSTGFFVDSSGLEKMSMNVIDTTLTMQHDTLGPNIPTIRTQDETSAAAPLNLSIGELQVNSDSGTTGQVLTSNGTGAAPTWEDASVTVFPSDATPQSIGTATPGVSAEYARGDHVHDGSLADLDDVSATAPTLGQVLAWGGTEWSPSSMVAYDQMLYVADGADVTLANGSPVYPFASISAALASITDASPTKRYTILITAGEYTEVGTVNLKPNVFLCGIVPDAVRITATTWALDASFTGGADNRSGIHNCIVNGAVNLNFTTVTSTAGKFYARNTIFTNAVTLTGYNNSIVQAQFSNCQFFGLVTVQGVNVGVANDNIHYGGLTLTQSPFNVPTIWAATGGTMSGTLTATTTVNDFNRRISLFCKSFWMGTVVIDGPSTYLDYTVDSLPVAGATVLNGANLVLINPPTTAGANTTLSNLDFPTAVNNPIIPANTNATNMGDWDKQWMFNFGYVHLSSGTELYLASAGASASPDSAGRSIYIESDAYGLDTDVNGGDINITTQAGVSGTGVRGKIGLNASRVEINGAYSLPNTDGTAGQVMVTDGSGVASWQNPTGGIAGTIAANEVAFGTGVDTIGGSANLTFDGSKMTVTGVGSVFELASDIDGVFLETDTNFYTVTLKDPLGSDARIDMSSVNGIIAAENEIKITKAEAPSTHRLLALSDDGTGKPAIKTDVTTDGGATFNPDALRFVTADWEINGNAGATGQVLTSNGTGASPTWEDATGGGVAGTIAATQLAFGTSTDTIGGDARLTYDSGTNIVELSTSVGATGVKVSDSPNLISSDLQAGALVLDSSNLESITLNVNDTSLTLRHDTSGSNIPTIKARNQINNTAPLALSIQDLIVNNNPGASGQVLTSLGAGVAPIWSTPPGGVVDGDYTDITVSGSGSVWTIDDGVVTASKLATTGTPTATTFLNGDMEWESVVTSVAQTDVFYVDGNLGNDATADGSLSKPFKTIQACLNYMGQPSNRNEALRHCVVYISGKAIDPASGTELFSGIYVEDLTVPNRFLTMIGAGIKIQGTVLKEYSSSRRFGVSSSEFRPCLTTMGLTQCRDTHSRIRTGFHISGTVRTSILRRNIGSIVGNGSNKVTIVVAPGQFTYPIVVGDGTAFFPRIRIAVQGTTLYNATYDITAKIDDTTFEATRVSGTNANTTTEVVGTFFESDSAGASGLSHDAAHYNTYLQGLYTCDDGTVNGAAPTAGTEVMYLEGCRVFSGIEGRTILMQKCFNTTIGNYMTVNSIDSIVGSSFGNGTAGIGNITTSTFTYTNDSMGLLNNRFNNSITITVSTAGQTVRMDSVTLNGFLSNGGTWVTNTPSINYLDDALGTGFTPTDARQWGIQSSGTATAGAASTLTDSTKSATWVANQFIGSMVTITGGTGAGQTRRIVSNTTTALTVAPNWTTNPTAGSTYALTAVNTVHEGLNYLGGLFADGDKVDITVSGSGSTWTIDNGAVTYAKIQNVSATDKLLGRASAGAGVIEEITLTSAGRALIDDIDAAAQRTTLGLGTMATETATNYLLRSGGTMTGALNITSELQSSTNPGTAGQVLTSNGPGLAPTWEAGGGGAGSLPAGGATNDILQKISATDYDTDWTDELTIDKVNYDTTAAETATTGQTTWNADFGTLDIGMLGSSVIQKVGLEQMYLVKNQTGTTITKGQTIRAAGTTGNSGRILASLAIADNSVLPEYVIGVALENIADGADGYVSSFGLIRQLDLVAMATAAGETWADGDVLYVSPTTPGAFTKIEPSAPDQKIIMAMVVHYHTNGALFVRVTNGQHLYDLHDVYAPAPTNGQVLAWNASNNRWEATNAAAAVNQYHQEFTGVGGETVFNLSFSYTIGTNKLRVYKNGILLRVGTSYTETSTTSVTLTDALVLNDELTFEYIS